MNLRHFQISSVLRVRRPFITAVLSALTFFAIVPRCVAGDVHLVTFEESRNDTLTEFPTHDQFVRYGIDMAVDSLFETFSFSRPKPLWIAPADGQAANHWFEESAARVLFDHGFMVREAPDQDTNGARIWAVRYRFDRLSLSLPHTARHSFLGKIWVNRMLDATILVHVWDMESGELVWSNSSYARLSDWIPKRQLPELSQVSPPLTSPVPPVTAAERLAEPVLVTAAVGALTILFFAVR